MQTDTELINRFLKGDDSAFCHIYNYYKQMIYAFCLKMLGDSDAAKDAVQETFLKAYQHQRQLNAPEKIKSWLYTIARNYCLSSLKRSQLFSNPNCSTNVMNIQSSESIHSDLEQEEEIQLINNAVAELKPAYREVIILRDYQSLSYKEIALITGVTESAVKSKLFKARRLLYEQLKPILQEGK